MTLIYAHRGASATHPENTLLAFRAALAADVDGIELDVHATGDGVPVVIHDDSVDRTTGGNGYVSEMSLAQLQAIDAGWGERVPTLIDVLTLVGGEAHLDIEIKNPTAAPQILDVLQRFPQSRHAISSFDWDTLRAIRARDAHTELWPLADEASAELVAIAAELGSPRVALASAAYTAESAGRLRRGGLEAIICTINDTAEARRVQRLGAYALCTDDPVTISAAILGAKP